MSNVDLECSLVGIRCSYENTVLGRSQWGLPSAVKWPKGSGGNYSWTSDIVRPKCCKCLTNISICSNILSEHFD